MSARFSMSGVRDASVKFIGDFLHTWIGILADPRSEIGKRWAEKTAESTRLRKSVAYAATSLVASMCLAQLTHLRGMPSLLTPQLVVGGILFWSITGILIHGAMRLVVRGSGTVASTVAVFLYVSGTLLVIWMAIFSVLQSTFVGYDTTLTYEYAIEYRVDVGGEGGGWGRGRALVPDSVAPRLLGPLQVKNSEYFGPGQWNATVARPAVKPDVDNCIRTRTGCESKSGRVALPQSPYPQPTISHVAGLKEGTFDPLVIMLTVYYLSHFWYLANGLSSVHGRSRWLLFALAVFGGFVLVPLVFVVGGIALLAL